MYTQKDLKMEGAKINMINPIPRYILGKQLKLFFHNFQLKILLTWNSILEEKTH